MRLLETAIQIVALGAALWVFAYQLPRARREQDRFAVICSVLTGLLALFAWLLLGEAVGAVQMLGGVLVLIGIRMTHHAEKKR